jgi:predicted nucleic acid-binding protein
MVLVDTNILLDVIVPNPDWLAWSAAQLLHLGKTQPMIINPIVYAEVSVSFSSVERLEANLASLRLEFREVPREVCFLAGKAFSQYRRNGGTRTSLLPDFFIGAHAQLLSCPLLTRDTARYATYFPSVALITP